MLGALNGSRAARIGATLGFSALGGLAARLAGLPAGWISGGLVVVAAVSLAGLNSDVPTRLRPPIYLVLGIFSGNV